MCLSWPMEVNSKIAIFMSEKHSTICHAISWSRDGPKLWSRAIQCGCLSRFAFSRSCPIAAPNKDLPGGSHFSKLLNLLNHHSSPAPIHFSHLFTASQNTLPHLFPSKTLSNKSGIYSALDGKAGHWLLVSTGQNTLSEVTCFQEKDQQNFPCSNKKQSLHLPVFSKSGWWWTNLSAFRMSYSMSMCFSVPFQMISLFSLHLIINQQLLIIVFLWAHKHSQSVI